ncbi:cellulose synthase/poly-beta-1,6-N-acetylglucosamine synthase-like glycosyltransferase [Pedobacter sp. UYP30]|uniref:glycosyltransferase family 2 protein n=1 Tax=Pedobacter sp. UYP30 TaxID=1756400 RepID=UPI0033995302
MEILNLLKFLSNGLTFIYVILVLSFIIGWVKLPVFQLRSHSPKTKVSIIIAARNEEINIERTIKALLTQNYPKALIEVIIVDDQSTDRTAEIVEGYASKGIKLLKLNPGKRLNSYKKKAIETAIGLSCGDLIVTTDADCSMGSRWLSTIVGLYEEKGFKMISSPVMFFEERNLFERMQTLEFLYLIGMGASTIGNKMPSTCNGANLAYQKKVFLEVGGFKGIDDLASGDDELLLHKIAAKYPNGIGFLKNTDAMVYTDAKDNLGQFIQQRKRWASKSTKYKNKAIILLGILIWTFNLSILANVVLGLFFSQFFLIAGYQLLAKFALELCFLVPVTSFAKRRKLLLLSPILTILHIFYMVYIGIAGNSGKYNWKDRMVK